MIFEVFDLWCHDIFDRWCNDVKNTADGKTLYGMVKLTLMNEIAGGEKKIFIPQINVQ